MGIGDELMAAGEARAHFARTGRPVKIMRQAVQFRWFDVWNGLPYILGERDRRPHDVIHAKDTHGLRAYIAGKADHQWTWRRYAPQPAELCFTRAEIEAASSVAGAVLIEPNVKPKASPNKDWRWWRWQRLVELRPDLDWVQPGPQGTRSLQGVRRIPTATFRQAAAMLAACRAAVLPEGGLHHAAAAVGVKAVVIYGGFISPAVTGYPGQRGLFIDSDKWPIGCGMRVPCTHCEQAMAAITPEQVLRELEAIL